jgi:hypothetical protein
MTRYPGRLLIIAIICAVLQFLLGAPSLSEGTGTVQDVSAVLQLIVTLIGLAALALAAVGFIARRRSPR